MKAPKLTGRRSFIAAGSMSLAAMTAPALAEGVQPEGADKRKEPGTFNLWVMSDAHVSTDKAVSVARLA